MATSSNSVIIRKKSTALYPLFAVCPGGLEKILESEIASLGAPIKGVFPGGVDFEGNLELAYTACLSLRTASRVLLLLKQSQEVRSADALYQAVFSIDWARVFLPNQTFAVWFTESHTQNPAFYIDPQFLALKAKDAIADFFLQRNGSRPNVDRHSPDVTIRLHLHNHTLKIYFDLSGESLHERGYRHQAGEAPLKENLAAGLLLLADWHRLATPDFAFYDPFCGSGTLAIEAALIATKTAPGLLRHHYGFLAWRDHQRSLYDQVRAKLEAQIIHDPNLIPAIFGTDQAEERIRQSRENADRAGMGSFIRWAVTPFETSKPPAPKGLIVTNPPYGIRIGEETALLQLYAKVGSTLKHHYTGWRAGFICSNLALLQSISLKPSKKVKLHNGSIETIFQTYALF